MYHHDDTGRDKSGRNDPEIYRNNQKGDATEKDKGDGKRTRWPITLALPLVMGGLVCWFLTWKQGSAGEAYLRGAAISIAPQSAAYIVARHVDANSFAQAGDPMLRLDHRHDIDAREKARANLELALAELASAKIDLDVARLQNPLSRQALEAQLEEARVHLAHAELNLSYTVTEPAGRQGTRD